MNRRVFLQALSSGLVAVSLAADAQPVAVRRVGVLSPASSGPSPLLGAFQKGLGELGWVDGRNVRLEYRFAETRHDRLPGLASDLVSLKVEAILAINSVAAQAALKATKTIPVVFTWVADPLSLVTNLARPGGNVTGLTTLTTELSGKRLQLFKDLLPGITRIAVIWNPAVPAATNVFREMEGAAAQLGVQLHPMGVRAPGELPDAFTGAVRAGARALFVIEEAALFAHRARILSLAAQHRLPAASQFKDFAEAGGLLSYGPNLADLFRRAAIYVDKILKGAKPGDLPVERPEKFELAVNLKTAKILGLPIPPSLLQRADQVIE